MTRIYDFPRNSGYTATRKKKQENVINELIKTHNF